MESDPICPLHPIYLQQGFSGKDILSWIVKVQSHDWKWGAQKHSRSESS